MRLVDADKIEPHEQLESFSNGQAEFVMVAYMDDIDALPTVDAVPVVRCKDCKHYQFADNRAFGFPVKRCEWTGFEDVDDEDFCSRGERKDGDA